MKNIPTRLIASIKQRTRQRGAAVLEMALAGVVMIPLTFGAIEFSDAYFKKNTMQGAAREGARAAIVSGATISSVQTAVTTAMTAAGINSNNYTISITDSNDTAIGSLSSIATGTAIKVTVSGRWGDIGLRPCGFLSADKHITGVAVMRKES